MAATVRAETEMKLKATKKLSTATDPLEMLQLQCLARGANGIRGLSRSFKVMDDDGNKSLDFKEFKTGLQDYGILLNDDQIKQLFASLDKDQSGLLNFDEFLKALRPPMRDCRKEIIMKVFKKLDKTGDAIIEVNDLKGVYDARKHPKYLNGEWTEDQVLRQFLDTFDPSDNKDGKVTKDEFLDYYAGVSASIDQDAYFDLMMRNAWKL